MRPRWTGTISNPSLCGHEKQPAKSKNCAKSATVNQSG